MFKRFLCLAVCLVMGPTRADTLATAEMVDSLAANQEPMPTGDPVDFLAKCLDRYNESGIKGYRCILRKQERIAGKLQPTEETELCYRETPLSVFMHWIKGQRRAESSLVSRPGPRSSLTVN